MSARPSSAWAFCRALARSSSPAVPSFLPFALSSTSSVSLRCFSSVCRFRSAWRMPNLTPSTSLPVVTNVLRFVAGLTNQLSVLRFFTCALAAWAMVRRMTMRRSTSMVSSSHSPLHSSSFPFAAAGFYCSNPSWMSDPFQKYSPKDGMLKMLCREKALAE